MTVDGVLYYYNPATEKVTYEKPDELKTDEERKEIAGEWVWVRDEKEVWLPGRVIKKETNDTLRVEIKGRGTKQLTRHVKNEPLWPVSLSSLNRLEDDMVLLDDLNDAMMIHDVKERYKKDQIYTWVGASQTVLVSINPFKRLPIYGIQMMNEFARPAPNKILPPHPFSVANSAYIRLRIQAQDQAMLISGESGAGKTETTKQILSFLAEIAGSSTNVEQRILSANPVLEAFGNAKTVRNNNSSRFGRWMQVHFDERGSISSAHIENYLLEKSRVVSLAKDERSYHIFYQLIISNSNTLPLENDASKHTYLAQSRCFKVKNIDDKADFKDVSTSLQQLAFTDNEVNAIFSLTAGCLRIGDLEFVSSGDGSQICKKNNTVPLAIVQLLGLNSIEALTSALTNKAIEVRGARTLSPCSPENAREGADALAKAIFGRLFDWLVQRINKAVANDDEEQNIERRFGHKYIGVLDIFGFEIMERNSFEQLLINYTNEKLQQHFNRHTFKEETHLYTEEGIDFEPIAFIDNQPILDLIEKRPDGILLLLDDEITAPKGNDAKWLSKCEGVHAGKSEWLSLTEKHASASGRAAIPNKIHKNYEQQQQQEDFFGVTHYAGDVKYISTNFCHKNKDPLGRNLYDLMALEAPGFDIVSQNLFPPLGTIPRRQPTIAGQFRKQLTSLMKIIDAASPCYIRCIKPNSKLCSGLFETASCVEQLTYAGVFEAVKIRKSGYPFRLAHRQFAARYRILIDSKRLNSISDLAETAPERTRCTALLNLLQNQEFVDIKIGNSMVLYRAPEHRVLELLRNLALERLVPIAQRALRIGTGRVYRKVLKKVRCDLQAALDSPNIRDDAAALDTVIDSALSRIGPHQTLFPWLPPELDSVRQRRNILQERLDLDEVMRALLNDPVKSQSYDDLAHCVRRADAIAAVPGTPQQMALEQNVRDALNQVAGKKLDPIAQAAIDVLDKALMETIKEEARRARYTSDDLKRIDEYLAMSDEALTKLQLKRANELDDPDRVVNREIKLKQLMIETYASMYQIPIYAGLREKEEWAARKSRIYTSATKRQKIADSMLKHQSNAIHCALSDPKKRMDAIEGIPTTKDFDKKAVLMFKCILGFLGESKHPYPESLGSECLSIALSDESLRAEFYLQLTKQLNENPTPASIDQAWQLLAAAFATFPPPPSFENFVALFVKQHAPLDKQKLLISGLYSIVYGGERKNPVTAEELPHLIARTLNSEISARYLDVDIVSTGSSTSLHNGNNHKMPPPPPLVQH
uniref:Myosin motor domain-containing protein n=1 Tax=Aureoumbra lagunensis TaxID=44058 RepID=A0A6S8C1X6_9STRA